MKTIFITECLPKELDPDTLYVTERFNGLAYLCPCGCAKEVYIPTTPTDEKEPHRWNLKRSGDNVTLTPSVMDNGCPKKSHYWITDSKVVWC